MTRPDPARLRDLLEQFLLYAQLKHEHGAPGMDSALGGAETSLQAALEEARSLPVDPALAEREPDDLLGIRRLRPEGPRRLWGRIPLDAYREKLAGALLGRMAGCILGAPVEGTSPEFMYDLCRQNSDPFPPVDYWKAVPAPYELRGGVSRREDYTREKMDGVPVDDDLAYTILGLLIAEAGGPNFTTQDVADLWLKYLPFAYTAEEVALRNLRARMPALEAGGYQNPFSDWIGADIRADPWGYLAPGWPEKAAELAQRDAYLSHRRGGVHGAMFFAAAISAAFAVPDAMEALHIGLTEIPAGCRLAEHVRWALETAPGIASARAARAAVAERFPGMSAAHTFNNACLTVFGLSIGGPDFTRVIGETVAMGLDNDCTTATAGSIAGALLGREGIPPHWYAAFHDTLRTYLNGLPRLSLADILERFACQAERFSKA